jgi:hypothetical protein
MDNGPLHKYCHIITCRPISDSRDLVFQRFRIYGLSLSRNDQLIIAPDATGQTKHMYDNRADSLISCAKP